MEKICVGQICITDWTSVEEFGLHLDEVTQENLVILEILEFGVGCLRRLFGSVQHFVIDQMV
jgi:hypothetical protein